MGVLVVKVTTHYLTKKLQLPLLNQYAQMLKICLLQEFRAHLLKPTIPIQNQSAQIHVIHNRLVKDMLANLGEYQIPLSITNEGLDVTPPFQYYKSSIYLGGLEKNQFQGYGEIYQIDGTHYCGQFNKGTRFGHGRLIFPDGDAYEGEWLDDMQHGKGIYWYSDGGIYDGCFLNDLKHGFGKETLANNETYEGDFYNGFGKFTDTNGEVIQDQWVDCNKKE